MHRADHQQMMLALPLSYLHPLKMMLSQTPVGPRCVYGTTNARDNVVISIDTTIFLRDCHHPSLMDDESYLPLRRPTPHSGHDALDSRDVTARDADVTVYYASRHKAISYTPAPYVWAEGNVIISSWDFCNYFYLKLMWSVVGGHTGTEWGHPLAIVMNY